MDHVLEVVVFRLVDGADTDQFLKDAQATFDLLNGYPGFVTRQLTSNDDGTWIDVVTWDSLDTALSAAEAVMSSAVGQAFGRHIDTTAMQMYHTTPRVVSQMTA